MDVLREQLNAESKIDVKRFVEEMRRRRKDMVQTVVSSAMTSAFPTYEYSRTPMTPPPTGLHSNGHISGVVASVVLPWYSYGCHALCIITISLFLLVT